MNRVKVVGLVLLTFFVISFLTNILGPIIPDIIDSFDLSLGLAGFLPFAFFLAYGVMSVPSGVLVEKYQEKNVMIAAFAISSLGALQFALMPTFAVAMVSLFLIGVGMAMLQVAINPLLREAGGKEHFAFNSVLGQLCFGAASFFSPQVYSHLVTAIPQQNSDPITQVLKSLVPEGLAWVSLYWVFAVVSILMVVIIAFVKLPKVEQADDEKVAQFAVYKELFRNKTVLMFFFGIVCYVGTEQGVANWMSQYMASYHDVDPKTQGADMVSLFWGLLTLGCVLGLLLLKVMDSKLVLLSFSLAAIVSLLIALVSSKDVAIIAFPLVGFFLSVMWSVIFSLALNSMPSQHGAFSGILCTGIIGGAIMPLLVGNLAEVIGLKMAMACLVLPLGYIGWIGVKASPLIRNKTIWKEKTVAETA